MTEADFYPWWLQDQESESAAPISPHHHVNLVLLNHNGERWLSETLRAVGSQSRQVDFATLIDCGSKPPLQIPTEGFTLQSQPAGLSFGQYVNRAVEKLEVKPEKIEWIWILHDDSAPHAHALAELLRAADANPQAVVFGPKLVDWRNPEHVLEIGTSLTGIGTRFTGLETGERDQGQHDRSTPALSVGSAGMLIRRDVWQVLGGFSEALPHFRVDTEFCLRVWESGNEVIAVGGARVRHVAATARDIRKPAMDRSSSHFVDRRAGMLLVLSRTPRRLLWFRLVLMLLAGLTRGAGYLLLQDLKGARDEWRATASLFFNPIPIQKLRAKRGQLPIPRQLKPSLKTQYQHLSGEVGNAVSATWQRVVAALFPKIAETDEIGRGKAFGAILRRPGSILTVVTVLFGMGFSFKLLGSGQLTTFAGIVPDSTSDIWQQYLQDLHPVGMGNALPAHPFLGILGFLSAITFTTPAVFVERLLIFGPWLAALSMHLGLRSLIRNAPTRVWLAALYGLSPVLVAAIRIGDVAVVLIAILLPGFLHLLSRELTWRVVGSVSLLMAVFIAIWPAFWFVALVIVIGFAFKNRSNSQKLQFGLFGLFAPLLMLLPWSLQLLRHFELWFEQFGYPASSVPVWQALLSTGLADARDFWWLQLPLFGIALASLIDRRHSSLHSKIWVLFSIMLGVGLAGQVLGFALLSNQVPNALSALAMVMFGLLVISLASATSFVSLQLHRSDFGWRQIATVISVLLISLIPIAGILATRGIANEQVAKNQDPVTAEMLRGFTEDLRLRTLFLTTAEDGAISASILDGRPNQFGDSEVMGEDVDSEIANRILQWLTQGVSTDENPLFDLGIGYVATNFADEVETLISSRGNLERLITARNPKLFSVWRVTDVNARTYVVAGESELLALGQFNPDSAALEVSGILPVSPKTRILQIAERSNSAWSATLNNEPLEVIPGELQSWRIPANQDGEIKISYFNETRISMLLVAWFVVGTAVVMIAPRRRHIYRDEWMAE